MPWTEDLKGLRFHDLRHTAASLMIKLGVHPKLVSTRLGHSDIGTTMNIYGHLYPGQDAEVADQLDDEYREAQEKRPTSVSRIH